MMIPLRASRYQYYWYNDVYDLYSSLLCSLLRQQLQTALSWSCFRRRPASMTDRSKPAWSLLHPFQSILSAHRQLCPHHSHCNKIHVFQAASACCITEVQTIFFRCLCRTFLWSYRDTCHFRHSLRQLYNCPGPVLLSSIPGLPFCILIFYVHISSSMHVWFLKTLFRSEIPDPDLPLHLYLLLL